MRLTDRRCLWLFATPVLLTLAVAATGAQASSHSQAAAALVKLAPAHVLVNAKGLTLYVFAPDSKNKSTCYGDCAKFWPPVLVSNGAKPTVTIPGLKGTFGVAMRTNGTHQLTFDGAPLYTFLGDKQPGDMDGQGLVAAGGYWWVVVAGTEK